MQKKRILIVEDDLPIGDMLEELLCGAGYAPCRAYSGTEALLLLEKQPVDLVLLDLMLPGLSGEQVLSRVQGAPVIVLSAKSSAEDKVALLLGGAVDYVTKPFDARELLARVAVALRDKASAGGTVRVFRNIRLDTAARQVQVGQTPVHLTRTEFAILAILMQNAGQVVTKSSLLDRMAEMTPDCTENTLKMHVSNLRRKLRAVTGRDDVEAVWGIGFRMRA